MFGITLKKILISAFFFFLSHTSFSQKELNVEDSMSFFFEEIKAVTKKHSSLWGIDLYGSMILINPQTRQVYANEVDSAHILKPKGLIFTGILPKEINIANTSINWNGKRWAMIMLPLPKNKQERILLLAHELFHKQQPVLGFELNNPDNIHLDQKEARIYLRLELEALKKAICATSSARLMKNVTAALTFRKYRHLIYKGASIKENELELNEGLAEYTGLMLSEMDKVNMKTHLVHNLNTFITHPSFVRSFAYQTTPLYGYLLHLKNIKWNDEITGKTDLTNYFISKFKIHLPSHLSEKIERISKRYNGKLVSQLEILREEKIEKIRSDYKLKFIQQPHVELNFENMNVSFDPRNVLALEDVGTVYAVIRVSDVWGILAVEKGALMNKNWDKITVTRPVKIEERKFFGEGWALELTAPYDLEKDSNGNYKLVKK
jgi:hypothetical protein